MAWCTIAHLGGGLAIGGSVAARIARVVEFCMTTAELSMTLCTLAHLGGKLAIGLSIAARIAL
eukprot:2523363-Rhodomonas_salina.1